MRSVPRWAARWIACAAPGARRAPPETALAERHPQHFLDRRHTVAALLKRVLPEGLHALRRRRCQDLVRGRVAEDEVADLVRDRHHLVDGDSPLHAGEVAGLAPLVLVEVDRPQPLGHVPVGHEAVLARLVGLLAVLADAPPQALGQDCKEPYE